MMIKGECMNFREYGYYISGAGVHRGKKAKHMGRENEGYIIFSHR